MTTGVRVTGLREVQAAFRKVDADIPKGLRDELRPVAQMIAGESAAKVPWITGTAARSITPTATQRGAGISMGGARAPYMPWLDFGGSVGRNDSVKRPVIRGGRYVYPTIEEKMPEIVDAVEAAVVNAAKRAGFEVR